MRWQQQRDPFLWRGLAVSVVESRETLVAEVVNARQIFCRDDVALVEMSRVPRTSLDAREPVITFLRSAVAAVAEPEEPPLHFFPAVDVEENNAIPGLVFVNLLLDQFPLDETRSGLLQSAIRATVNARHWGVARGYWDAWRDYYENEAVWALREGTPSDLAAVRLKLDGVRAQRTDVSMGTTEA